MKKIIPKVVGSYLNSLSLVAPKKAGQQAFRLFCYPQRKRLLPHQRQFLDTAEHFHFSHQHLQIQGYRWGSGPKKVLFLHGWQSHSFRWKKYIEALSQEDYSIYAIDAPGHGLSTGRALTVPLYSDVIEQLISRLGPIDTLISHSIGSFSAMHALHQYPGMPVKKLLIMGSPGKVEDFILFYQQTLQLSERTLHHTKAHFEKVIEKPVSYFSATTFASSLKVPGLIIHDREDRDAPYHYAKAIHKVWEGSKLLTTEGLGHNLKSEKVVQAVKGFVEADISQPNHAQDLPFSVH